MTEIYCFVDDFLKARPALSGWRRSPHAAPRFTDAEVITIALLQADVGTDTLKRTYDLVAKNWRAAFPRLPSYAQWLARLHRLTRHVGALLEATCAHDPTEAALPHRLQAHPAVPQPAARAGAAAEGGRGALRQDE